MASATAAGGGRQRLRIIWAAFVAAAAFYAVVPYLIVLPGGAPMPLSVRSALHFAAAGAAVSSFVARRWWTHSLAAARDRGGSAASAGGLAARLTAGCVVTWALGEVVSIMGLVVALLAHDPGAALPLALGGVVVLALHRPSVWPLDAVP